MKKFGSKNSLVLFFVLTISLAWIWWIPMALGLWPAELRIVPSSLGGISPILTLWILQKWSNHKVDLNRIIASVHNWRTNIPWLLAAVFILPVLTTLGNILNYILGFEDQFTLLEPGPAELGLILIPVIPITFVANLITSSLFEEPGWRGFALPKLQEKLGRELGSFVIGSYWWLWHQMSNIRFWGVSNCPRIPIDAGALFHYRFFIQPLQTESVSRDVCPLISLRDNHLPLQDCEHFVLNNPPDHHMDSYLLSESY